MALTLKQIEAAGFTVSADGDRLTVTPASKLTAEQRAKIKAGRDSILAEVRARDLEALDAAVLGRPPPGDAGRWQWDRGRWTWCRWYGSDGIRPTVGDGESSPNQTITPTVGIGC